MQIVLEKIIKNYKKQNKIKIKAKIQKRKT